MKSQKQSVEVVVLPLKLNGYSVISKEFGHQIFVSSKLSADEREKVVGELIERRRAEQSEAEDV